MSDTLVPWDRITDGINRRLPAWARYSGHSTWALAMAFYALLAMLISVTLYTRGIVVWAGVAAAVMVICGLVADYHRKAAKLRVECANCGREARGNDECPHCGQPTFMEANQ